MATSRGIWKYFSSILVLPDTEKSQFYRTEFDKIPVHSVCNNCLCVKNLILTILPVKNTKQREINKTVHNIKAANIMSDASDNDRLFHIISTPTTQHLSFCIITTTFMAMFSFHHCTNAVCRVKNLLQSFHQDSRRLSIIQINCEDWAN